MSDVPLLVPMHVDALALSRPEHAVDGWLRFEPDYAALAHYKPLSEPFEDDDSLLPPAGVHLHWTLPRALRQGHHELGGATTFRLVPNRWLVVRIQAGVANAAGVKAWLVESDYTGDGATSVYADPRATAAPAAMRIGRVRRLTPDLVPAAPPDQAFLSAFAPANPTFAMYQPGLLNVFAFQDDMSDAADPGAPIGTGTFTYHVSGWYADPATDPLAKAGWKPAPVDDPQHQGALLAEDFGFALWTTDTPPGRMLVHGLVADVAWNRDATVDPGADGYPTESDKTVSVAFGTTAPEALAAILRLDPASAAGADALEALAAGLLDCLDTPGSAEAIEMGLREHRYGSSPGGLSWTVVTPDRSPEETVAPPAPPPLTGDQLDAVTALNAAQREYDRQARILESMRWNLYSLWWKAQFIAAGNNPLGVTVAGRKKAQWLATQLRLHAGLDTGAGNGWYIDAVKAQVALVDKRRACCDSRYGDLTTKLNGTPWQPKSLELPQFRSPNDPVLLAVGLGRSTPLDPVADLRCRLPAQTVRALKVDGQVLGEGGEPVPTPPLEDPSHILPSGVQELHAEAMLLSPTVLATATLGAAHADDVAASLAALPAPGGAATFPPAAGSFDRWRQPWAPLLLDWEVTLLREPAYEQADANAPGPTFVNTAWRFDGTDYAWNGPTQWKPGGTDFDETASGTMQLRGRTFLSPHLPLIIADQLRSYCSTHSSRNPGLDALEQRIAQIEAQDVLSQRLSGLFGLLGERDHAPAPAPAGDLLALLGDDAAHTRPRPFPDPVGAPVWDFAPMSGTFMVVNRLLVVDAFGRAYDLMLSNLSRDPQHAGESGEEWFYPIAGHSLKSPTGLPPGNDRSADPTKRMLQLPPRLVQDARLLLELASADGDDTPVQAGTDPNPICAWLVPNHLDRSIAVFAADGTAWGELGPGAAQPSWQPQPTSADAPQQLDAIPNAYARDVLGGLTGAGLDDLLRAIDEAQWSIDPGGDQDLPVIVGRPLALVRASLSLRLRGLAYLNQDWWNVFAVDLDDPGGADPRVPAALADVDGGVRTPTWPVRLGSRALRDDGLIGCYIEDETAAHRGFGTFAAVAVPAGADSGYLRPLDGAALDVRVTDDSDATPDPARHEVRRLLMLMDPRAAAHAFSGLLPVAVTSIPDAFTTPALRRLAYTFRSGPILTSPERIRMPLPAARHGRWAWLDRSLEEPVEPARADSQVRISATPPIARDGWLVFTPDEED